MANCLMEGKRDDGRIVALNIILGDAKMIQRQEFWICSNLSQLEHMIGEPKASLG